MNESVDSLAGSDQTSAPRPMSAGLLMRHAREANALDVSALAAILKVPVSKIEALESDRFDALPDLVFARALASSVCRSLKIDADSVLTLMPGSITPTMKTDESGINTPFKASGETSGWVYLRHLSKPVVLFVIALLAGALLLLLPGLLPTAQNDSKTASNADETPQLQSNAMLFADGAAVGGGVAASPADSIAPDAKSSSVTAVNDGSSTASAGRAVSETSAPLVEGTGTRTGLLVLTAKETAWVEVVDSTGAVQVRKTLQAGDVVGVSGVPPLVVVLGRADAVRVQVRGQPFEIPTRTKDNVARFEVR